MTMMTECGDDDDDKNDDDDDDKRKATRIKFDEIKKGDRDMPAGSSQGIPAESCRSC